MNDTRRTTLFAENLLGALGTLPLCQVPRQGHSAKRVTSRTQNAPVVPITVVGRYSLPSAATEHSVFNYFAECLHKGIRQTGSRASHEPVTLGGPWRPLLFPECLIYCTRQTWSRAVHVPITIGGPSRPFFFAECQKWGTRQKSCLLSASAWFRFVCRVSHLALGKITQKVSPIHSKLFSKLLYYTKHWILKFDTFFRYVYYI